MEGTLVEGVSLLEGQSVAGLKVYVEFLRLLLKLLHL